MAGLKNDIKKQNNMVHLESLSLEHFRGFDRVEINGFSKINVLLGENNCGKTSILEAIFLLTGIEKPQSALNVNAMRGIQTGKDTLSYLFHNLVTEEHPLFSGKFAENVSRELTITPVYESSALTSSSVPSHINPVQTSIPVSPELVGLDFNFSTRKENEPEQTVKTWLRFENGRFIHPLGSSYKGDLFSIFLNSNLTDGYLYQQLGTLMVDKNEKLINELLNRFDRTLTGIHALPNGIYLNKEGVSKLMPLQLFGRGLFSFLNIATIIAANKEKNFICLIDEIENGLHYSTQKLLWQSLFSLTRETNVQLFITTHSLEMLQTLSAVINTEAYEDVRDDIKVFTIANTAKAGFQSYGISYEGLESAIENQVELRS